MRSWPMYIFDSVVHFSSGLSDTLFFFVHDAIRIYMSDSNDNLIHHLIGVQKAPENADVLE